MDFVCESHPTSKFVDDPVEKAKSSSSSAIHVRVSLTLFFVFLSNPRMTVSGVMKQYQVVGRKAPTDEVPNPEAYRMIIFAPNGVIAKSKFWYYMHQFRKMKKTTGEILDCVEIVEKNSRIVKNYGIWLRYSSRSGPRDPCSCSRPRRGPDVRSTSSGSRFRLARKVVLLELLPNRRHWRVPTRHWLPGWQIALTLCEEAFWVVFCSSMWTLLIAQSWLREKIVMACDLSRFAGVWTTVIRTASGLLEVLAGL